MNIIINEDQLDLLKTGSILKKKKGHISETYYFLPFYYKHTGQVETGNLIPLEAISLEEMPEDLKLFFIEKIKEDENRNT